MPRIGLVHALRDSIAPTEAAFAEHWPAAELANLYDGSLYLDRSRGTADEAEIARRVRALLHHSALTGSDAILFTGSFFGSAVEAGRRDLAIPVLTSYEALVEAAFSMGRRFGVLATAKDSVALLEADIDRYARANGLTFSTEGRHVAGALDALLGGDPERHNALIAEATAELPECDAVLLAQFSMAPAKAAAARSGKRVLTAPEAGVLKLKRVLER